MVSVLETGQRVTTSAPYACSKIGLDTSPELWESPETTNMIKVWETLSPWFRSAGYNLYLLNHASPFWLTPSEDDKYSLTDLPVSHPYAYYSGTTPIERQFRCGYGITAAVNSLRRDVVIKLLYRNSSERLIFNLLASEPIRSDPLNFTVPVIEMLKYDEEFSFVVMPRWGDILPLTMTGFDCLETALKLVEDMLKALSFLHKHRVAHQDIQPHNILVNYQYRNDSPNLLPFLSTTRKQARFVLCDFGLSVMFSPDIPAAQLVCPAEQSEWGNFEYHPPDVADGQLVYDPFSYDVACLGGVLCQLVGNITPLIPTLAPFLDRLITPDIDTRYSAAQALDAFTALNDDLDPQFLATTAPPLHLKWGDAWQDHDRWAGLPSDFVKKQSLLYMPVRPKRKIQYFCDNGTEGSYFVDSKVIPGHVYELM